MDPSLTLHAVVIGINKYKSSKYQKLRAAVSDAKEVGAFLTQELGVPQSNITTLLNSNATQENILWALKGISQNPTIKRDDPILIYFAGHSDTVPVLPDPISLARPHCLCREHAILCPVDIVDVEEEGAHGIPVSVILNILDEIHIQKGNNTALILDCCGLSIRRICRLRDSRHDSYVILAACRENEIAYECRTSKSGLFTRSLLAALRGFLKKNNLGRVSYLSLMDRIHIPRIDQHPRIYGFYANRILFSTSEGENGRIKGFKHKGNTLHLKAGEAHGIRIGDSILIYRMDGVTYEIDSLGSLVVTQSDAISSTLQFGDNRIFVVPEIFYAGERVVAKVYCKENKDFN